MKLSNKRMGVIFSIVFIIFFLMIILIGGFFISEDMLIPNFLNKNQKPSLYHIFGTDWTGRDMFLRIIKGMSFSILIGISAASVSAIIAFVIGVTAATNNKIVDGIFTWITDLMLCIPHMLLLILISFATGGGIRGVVLGIVFTHWPSLSRIIRSEVLSLRESHYVKASYHLGKSKLWIARKHIFPSVFPQFITGMILLFPHAILHEAGITFLGFGLSPEKPAIGIILSESMKYLSAGYWWLAFFPGLLLIATVYLFDQLGNRVRDILSPHNSHE